MICSYCGIEWKHLRAASGLNHDDNDCPMAGVYTYPPVIESVNRAIDAAKVKGIEGWKFQIAEFDGDLHIQELKISDIGHSSKIVQFEPADKWKAEECGDFDEIDGSMVHCNHVAAYVPVEMCPCSAHTKGRICLK